MSEIEEKVLKATKKSKWLNKGDWLISVGENNDGNIAASMPYTPVDDGSTEIGYKRK